MHTTTHIHTHTHVGSEEKFVAPPPRTNPTVVVPENLGPLIRMTLILQGIAKDQFKKQSVQNAYIRGIQLLPPLSAANRVSVCRSMCLQYVLSVV